MTLPLTVLEEFFFWEDRPAYPCSCFVRLHFAGRLQRGNLERAIAAVVPRHRLMHSRIVGDQPGRLSWVAEPNSQPALQWTDGPAGGQLPSATRLDLRDGIGVRFFVTQDEAATDLTIQWHHSVCDGAGIYLFLEDLLAAYARECGHPSPPPVATFDDALLARRGAFHLTPRKFLRMLPRQLIGLKGAWQFMSRRPVAVVPHDVSPDDARIEATFPLISRHALTPNQTRRWRELAQQQQVTTNDLLARDLFVALHRWRERRGAADPSHWLRMMVPMNLRSRADDRLSACNIVGSVFLDRRGTELLEPKSLLRGINEEMSLIKRNQLGFTFPFTLSAIRRLPGGIRREVRDGKSKVSCVFTNLGSLFKHSNLPRRGEFLSVGDAVLMSVDTLAPLRQHSCLALAAQHYADRLMLTMHFDPRFLTQTDSDELLQTLIAQIGLDAAGDEAACSVR